MWCNCRLVYLPMSYLYGKRFVGSVTSVVLDLRKELYNVPYNEIDWDQARNGCAKVSLILTSPFLSTISSTFYLRQLWANFRHLCWLNNHYVWYSLGTLHEKTLNLIFRFRTTWQHSHVVAQGLAGEEMQTTIPNHTIQFVPPRFEEVQNHNHALLQNA